MLQPVEQKPQIMSVASSGSRRAGTLPRPYLPGCNTRSSVNLPSRLRTNELTFLTTECCRNFAIAFFMAQCPPAFCEVSPPRKTGNARAVHRLAKTGESPARRPEEVD